MTGTPPTITTDASIRAAFVLADGLRGHRDVSLLLFELGLCLTWDKVRTILKQYCFSPRVLRVFSAGTETKQHPGVVVFAKYPRAEVRREGYVSHL